MRWTRMRSRAVLRCSAPSESFSLSLQASSKLCLTLSLFAQPIIAVGATPI